MYFPLLFMYNVQEEKEYRDYAEIIYRFRCGDNGAEPQENEIIEIGALKVRGGRVAERFMEFIRPSAPLAPAITKLTGITDEWSPEHAQNAASLRIFLISARMTF